jgi:DNA-binding SARP family transcriptional activator
MLVGRRMEQGERTFLRTLGHPVLRRRDGSVVEGLRRKDLALLAYLCVEGDRPISRAHLAALLWGESPEDRARHSLTQALRRAANAVGRASLVIDRDTVRWMGGARCDAQLLLEGDEGLDELLTLYEGSFLENFEAGFGSEDFSRWADARRAELQRAAVRWLDRAGDLAEREGAWDRAQRIGERSVQIHPVWESGHRRVMRALLERGERNLALQHYRQFALWLANEVGGRPDPETTALADLIRATPTPETRPAPLSPPPAEVETPSVGAKASSVEAASVEAEASSVAVEASTVISAASSVEAAATSMEAQVPSVETEALPIEAQTPSVEAEAPAKALETPAAEEGVPSIEAEAPREEDVAEDAVPSVEPGEASVAGSGREVARLAERPVRWWMPSHAGALAAVVMVISLAGLLMMLRLLSIGAGGPAPGNGEVIRAVWGGPAYLVYDTVLYAIPDAPTMGRCLGGWTQRIRRVRSLPNWRRDTLPSVRGHRWLGGAGAVKASTDSGATNYVAVGCVLSPIPDSLTFHAIFGRADWSAGYLERAEVIEQFPTMRSADPFPLRRAGTLIQGAGDSIRWVVYHGGALAVRGDSILSTYCRARRDVVRVTEAEFRYYQAEAALPPATRPCRRP